MISKLIPKSEFIQDALMLITGTTIAQAIPIAISPIITRIYTPDDFGMFALYQSIALMVAVIATGRYELAIILPKKDEYALNIAALSIIISFFVSLISLLIVFAFNSQITKLLGQPEISNWLYFIPITVFLTGVYQSFYYWLNRKKQYKRLSTNKMVQSGSTATIKLGMGFSGFGSVGLLTSYILGQSLATTILGKIFFKEEKSRLKELKLVKIIALMIKYIKQPKYSLPNALIDGIRLSFINILISKYFSASILGQFSLAFKMSLFPITIIGGSLSQVFFQKISTLKKYDLHETLVQFVVKASLISAPIFLFIYLFAADIFKIVFGENWKIAGEAASIMAPWLFLNFISSPVASTFIVLDKQEIVLFVAIIYMLVPIGIMVALNALGFLDVLNIISIAMTIILIFYIYLGLSFTKKEKNEV